MSPTNSESIDPDILLSLVPDGFVLDRHNSKPEYGHRLKRIKASYCPICRRHHGSDFNGNRDSKGDNARLVVEGGKVQYCCFRDPENSRYVLDVIAEPPTPEGVNQLEIMVKEAPKIDIDKEATCFETPTAAKVMDWLKMGRNIMSSRQQPN